MDAVLTDAGRQRMARGNFKITKFALGDEEINYSLYNADHPSGSAFYDLNIMQTPVLEAFTDNASMMKSRLMTMVRNNILYLPVLKLNDYSQNENQLSSNGVYHLLADLNTQQTGSGAAATEIEKFDRGILRGYGTALIGDDATNHIAIDQGIDSTDGGITYKDIMPEDLVETGFLIRVDNRLLRIHTLTNDMSSANVMVPNQFVDDDGIATYFLNLGDQFGAIEQAPSPNFNSPFMDRRRRGNGREDSIWNEDTPSDDKVLVRERFAGPLGSILRFYPRTSTHVQNSSRLFDELGGTGTSLTISTPQSVTLANYKYIDTNINIVGITTGYSIDVPVRIVKKV